MSSITQVPDSGESGTPNRVGLAGLGAVVRFLLEGETEQIPAPPVQLAREDESGFAIAASAGL